jgi:hypothetical protein
MRLRLAVVLALVFGVLVAGAPHASAGARHVLAQSPSSESSPSDSGKDAKAPAPATEEEGPPWTYQMAKITLGLLVLVFLGMGLSYWKLIGSRQRGAA